MAQVVSARMRGDDYQTRWFWLQACRLFDLRPVAVRVGYEVRLARAFDDVVVYYRRPVVDELGRLIHADGFQAKFHVDHSGQFTYPALTEPGFINASKFSLLQRLLNATQEAEGSDRPCCFAIISTWPIAPSDPLGLLVSNQGGEIRLHKLREGGPRSEMGKVRALWREHLNLSSDDALEHVLESLRIRAGVGDLEMLRDHLNARLALAGLSPVPDDQVRHDYDELIRKLLLKGVHEFDREALQEICKREGLWRGTSFTDPGSVRLGIRSFMRFAENMEDETDRMISLVHHFDNRLIREPGLWSSTIYPEVEGFLRANVRPGGIYELLLDCHTSIAFGAGYSLDPKAGANLGIVQKTSSGRILWRPDETASSETTSLWRVEEIGTGSGGGDVALAISVTHTVDPDVELYVCENLPSVGRIFGFAVQPSPGRTAVRDGTHALRLARDLVSKVRAQRTLDERCGVLHVFGAVPNGFAFLLGREARLLGALRIYEHDFDTNLPGAYRPSLSFPTAARRTGQ